MCKMLGISSSGYYSWRNRPLSNRAKANARLLKEIQAVSQSGRGTYGSPKIHQILQKQGMHCDRKTVARLMRNNGIVAKRQRSFKQTTVQHPTRPAAANHLSQRFKAKHPNQVWLADMTYINTKEGWLYLAAVMDLYSRKIVGWSMSNRMTEELTMSALEMAVAKRLPVSSELMHHSDRGSQYTSKHYQQVLERYGIQVSMSSTGNCYDNAPMESFFSLLKTELVHHESYRSRRAARTSLFDYMEVFYNRQRVHSAIAYETPEKCELQWQSQQGDFEISDGPLGGRGTQTHP